MTILIHYAVMMGRNVVYSLVSISAVHADTDWATGYISQLEPNFTEICI